MAVRPPLKKQLPSLAALTKAGFTKWGKVEFDDGKWEIDNAVGADGKTYDVDLSATDMSVIKQEIDND